MARRRGDLPGRDERILEIAGYHPRRNENDSDDGLSIALRRIRGEGWHIHEFVSLAAVEESGAADPGRGALRSSHCRADLFESPRALPERGWKVPRSDLEADVELHRSIKSLAGRGVERDQRQGALGSRGPGDQAAGEERPAASWLRLVEGRRHHVLRQLDLLGFVHR